MSIIFVKDLKAECPICHTELDICTPKGNGSIPQGGATLRKVTRGIKKEIIEAYLKDPYQNYTTREIISRINIKRHFENKRQIERSDLTRPHSELLNAGVIILQSKENQKCFYKIHIDKARFVLSRSEF